MAELPDPFKCQLRVNVRRKRGRKTTAFDRGVSGRSTPPPTRTRRGWHDLAAPDDRAALVEMKRTEELALPASPPYAAPNIAGKNGKANAPAGADARPRVASHLDHSSESINAADSS